MSAAQLSPPASTAWAVPRPVLRVAVGISVVLVVPLAAVFVAFGLNPALSLALGYLGGIAPSLMLPRLPALGLTLLPAMAGAVAVAVNGQAFAAACFVAVSSLLVAPANLVRNGLLAGVPTSAAVLATMPATPAPFEVAVWMLLGGVVVGLVLAPLRKEADEVSIAPWSAWAHAVVMGAAVGTAVLLVTVFDVSHGYWICLTLTIVLRPYGRETMGVARERVAGTIGGAALAVGLAVVLPAWAVLVAVGALTVLMVAYAALGRTAQQVAFLTPVVVLLASGGAGMDTVTVALERVLATLLGVVVAALLALALARADRAHRARHRVPGADLEPPSPTEAT